MVETISKGNPAESVVSPDQKRFLYELTGLEPKIDGQNIFSDMSKGSRSESIYKTFRIDRIARSSIIPSSRWAVHKGTYDYLSGYKTTEKLALGGDYGTNVNPAVLGRPPDYNRLAATIASQQAPLNQRTELSGPARPFIRDVIEPAARTQPAPIQAQPRPQAQPAVPRALPVSGAPLAQPAAPHALPASGAPRAQPLNIDRSISARPGSFTPGRGRMQVQKIVMHSSDGSNAQGDINTLTGHDPQHPVSAHFYIERNGNIHQFVNT
jgi:N-acetylmuramoyl-L-alanine amidase